MRPSRLFLLNSLMLRRNSSSVARLQQCLHQPMDPQELQPFLRSMFDSRTLQHHPQDLSPLLRSLITTSKQHETRSLYMDSLVRYELLKGQLHQAYKMVSHPQGILIKDNSTFELVIANLIKFGYMKESKSLLNKLPRYLISSNIWKSYVVKTLEDERTDPDTLRWIWSKRTQFYWSTGLLSKYSQKVSNIKDRKFSSKLITHLQNMNSQPRVSETRQIALSYFNSFDYSRAFLELYNDFHFPEKSTLPFRSLGIYNPKTKQLNSNLKALDFPEIVSSLNKSFDNIEQFDETFNVENCLKKDQEVSNNFSHLKNVENFFHQANHQFKTLLMNIYLKHIVCKKEEEVNYYPTSQTLLFLELFCKKKEIKLNQESTNYLLKVVSLESDLTGLFKVMGIMKSSQNDNSKNNPLICDVILRKLLTAENIDSYYSVYYEFLTNDLKSQGFEVSNEFKVLFRKKINEGVNVKDV